MSQNAISIET